jgi:hypothetical protein
VQNVVNSLAVLAFLGTVVALFALSALLRLVRELQQAVMAASAAAPGAAGVRHVPRFASGGTDPTFVLVVSEHCPSCRDRAARLAAIAAAGTAPGRLAMLAPGDGCAAWVAGSGVEVVADAALLGALAVGATPSLVRFAPDGAEEWRRVVGSDGDLDRLLAPRAHVSQSSDVR